MTGAALAAAFGLSSKPGGYCQANANRRQRDCGSHGIEPQRFGESHRRGAEMQRLFNSYIHALGP